jgi:hypothetical protein
MSLGTLSMARNGLYILKAISVNLFRFQQYENYQRRNLIAIR